LGGDIGKAGKDDKKDNDWDGNDEKHIDDLKKQLIELTYSP
jgi:hypothetical protein